MKVITPIDFDLTDATLNPRVFLREHRGETLHLSLEEFSELFYHPWMEGLFTQLDVGLLLKDRTTLTESLWDLEDGFKESISFTLYGVYIIAEGKTHDIRD